MASYNIPNAPRQLDMNTFKALADAHDGMAKSCRYVSVIRPVGAFIAGYTNIARELMYLTEVAEMPGRGYMSVDTRYYGPNQKFPYQTTYEDMNMTFICRSRSFEREFFDDWQWYINPNNTFDFNYKDEYRSQIDVYLYSDFDKSNGGGPTAEYMHTLIDAYPILVNPQPISWADDQFLRLTVTFTYSWWVRKDKEPGPRVTGANASFNLVDTGAASGYAGSLSPRTRLYYD